MDAFILHHMGLGDSIIMNPVVNFYSKKYKTVHIFCKKQNYNNVNNLFMHLNNVIVNSLEAKSFDEEKTFIDNYINDNKQEDSKILSCGVFNNNNGPYVDIPENFYKEMNFDISDSIKYFKISDEYSTNVERVLSAPDSVWKNMVFMCAKSSDMDLTEAFKTEYKDDIKNSLIVCPHDNISKKYNKISNTFLDLPLLDYVWAIKQAKKVICIDSAFGVLSNFVARDSSEKIIHIRNYHGTSKNFYKGWEFKNIL